MKIIYGNTKHILIQMRKKEEEKKERRSCCLVRTMQIKILIIRSNGKIHNQNEQILARNYSLPFLSFHFFELRASSFEMEMIKAEMNRQPLIRNYFLKKKKKGKKTCCIQREYMHGNRDFHYRSFLKKKKKILFLFGMP